MTSLNDIHKKLGLTIENGLCITSDNKVTNFKKLEKLFEDPVLQKPHSVFSVGDKPFILFYENLYKPELIFKSIWNLNEAPIVIILQNNTVEIYNGFKYLKEQSSLAKLGTEHILNDFEYFKLVTGETWEKYNEQLEYENRVDFKLLKNIEAARDILINDCNLNEHNSNALLGKSIFTRYLIDRHVRIGFETSPREWTTNDFVQILTSKTKTLEFFKYLHKQFQEDLFSFDNSVDINRKALDTIIDLLNGVTLKTGQLSLFDVFNFAIIPIEFISNVYELFIGQKEQVINSAYYTPLFLVEYVTSQTINTFFRNNTKVYNCKVMDPACGSGIFLVESLRLIIERFNELNPTLSRGTQKYRDNLKKLAEDNIYGIDKDKSAISVAIFSVYLTLLDYQEPSDIEKFTFPKLLNKNFFNADFFDLNDNFNKILLLNDFNFILGNPPWKRGTGDNKTLQTYEDYIIYRKSQERQNNIEITTSNKEIAQAFLLRASDFANIKTTIALIVTSKILYNIYAQKFRKYLLTYYYIDKILELSPVRKEVFDKSNDPSIAPATIIFYRYAHNQNTNNNVTEHYSIKPNRFFSLFKIFIIQRNDIKTIQQKYLLENDWLWKSLLYGNFYDFYFIKRLKETYKTIKEILVEKDCLIGQGVMIKGNRKLQDSTHLIGKQFIRTTEDVKPFYLNINSKVKWTEQKALYPRNSNLFKAPLLLITGGINKEFKATTAISYKTDIVFKSSLTAIRSNNINLLENICGYFYSQLFAYYLLIIGSSAGVEREEAHDREKFEFPFIESTIVAQIVKKLHALKKSEVKFNLESSITFESLIIRLNDAIDKVFKLNKMEKALVDYGVNYVIPLIMKSIPLHILSRKLRFKDKFLSNYIDVFCSRFSKTFNKDNRSFCVEVWYSEQIIGIFFKVLHNGSKLDKNIKWIRKKDTQLMEKVMSLGHDKITKKLFIQKDIRGFEKKSFYIFKPNEAKLWHEALAYLDLNDFIDALLTAGKQNEYN